MPEANASTLLELQIQEVLAQNQQLSQRVTEMETTVTEIKNTIASFKKWIQVGVIAAITGIGGGVGLPLLNKSGDSADTKWMRDTIQMYLQAQAGVSPRTQGQSTDLP